MIGSLAAVPLPAGEGRPPSSPLYTDPLQDRLLGRDHIEVPVFPWPAPPQRMIRISAQVYNDERDYQRLCSALKTALAEECA
jgi:isopenicillin-N epimerase